MYLARTDVTVNLVFEDQSFHKQVSDFEALAIYATVSVEPESLGDLETGLERYCSQQRAEEICQEWQTGLNEPHNAATLILDFTAHIAAVKELPFDPRVPTLQYDEDTTTRCEFSWPDDWLIFDEQDYCDWAKEAKQERQKRQAIRRLEMRSVLYDTFVEFALAEAQRAGDKFDVVETHKKWLVTKRSDLLSKSPRDWLIFNYDHLQRDLGAQESFWLARKKQPPVIDVKSNAFRYAFFGPHEFVTYYEMCRHVLEWLADIEPQPRNEITLELVVGERNSWLNTLHNGFVPSYVIHQERKRFPLINHEEQDNHDCPICRMTGSHGFGFWHLFGEAMDFDFEFTPCKTRDDWELHYEYLYLEAQEWAEKSAEGERNAKQPNNEHTSDLCLENSDDVLDEVELIDEVELLEDDKPPISIGDFADDRIWKNSTFNRDAMRQLSPHQFIAVLMHGIIFCFAEFTQDLGESKARANQDLRNYAPLLLADVENLNDAVRQRSLWTVKSLVGVLQDTLSDIREIVTSTATQGGLLAKCDDLHSLLSELEVNIVAFEPEDKELQA
ncbi:MAG: hypothetical protein ACI9HK_001685 [Pirellulaceae bacterium]|jgi:hypothetical protein